VNLLISTWRPLRVRCGLQILSSLHCNRAWASGCQSLRASSRRKRRGPAVRVHRQLWARFQLPRWELGEQPPPRSCQEPPRLGPSRRRPRHATVLLVGLAHHWENMAVSSSRDSQSARGLRLPPGGCEAQFHAILLKARHWRCFGTLTAPSDRVLSCVATQSRACRSALQAKRATQRLLFSPPRREVPRAPWEAGTHRRQRPRPPYRQ